MDKPVKMTAEGIVWMLLTLFVGHMPILLIEPMYALAVARYLALFVFASALIVVGSAMIFTGRTP